MLEKYKKKFVAEYARTFYWIGPSPSWSQNPHRLHLGRKTLTVSILVAKPSPSPSWSQNPHRLHLGRKTLTVSILVGKPSPSSSWSQNPHRLHLGRKTLTVSILVAKPSPSPSWSQNPHRLHLGRKTLTVSILVAIVAQSQQLSRLLEKYIYIYIFLGRAVSALVRRVAPFHLGYECGKKGFLGHTVFPLVCK